MKRKILITFLGTFNYKKCNYQAPNGKETINDVRFVQEAFIPIFCKDWTENDKVIVFLTKEARIKNWLDDGHIDHETKETLKTTGLSNCISRLTSQQGFNFSVEEIDIPSGKSENELWEIFNRVIETLQDEDTIIYDLTHGFRSIPLLVMIVLFYARIVKNVRLKGIYYGAYDAIDKNGDAPIFDLTPFVNIFEWAIAVDNFSTFGDFGNIKKISGKKISEILRKSKGKNKEALLLNEILNPLNQLTKSIQTCRGGKLSAHQHYRKLQPFSYTNIKSKLENIKQELIPAFNPLIKMIFDKIDIFQNNPDDPDDDTGFYNGFAVSRWCLDNNLIQQGITMLQETIVTLLASQYFDKSRVSNKDTRGMISSVLNLISQKNIPTSEWKFKEEQKKDVNHLREKVDPQLAELFQKITTIRNDINHGGYLLNAFDPETFPTKLKTCLKEAEEFFELKEWKTNKTIIGKPRMFLCFSHQLTPEQIAGARTQLNVTNFIPFPPKIEDLWKTIPPHGESIQEYVEPVIEWITNNGHLNDYILVQGDYGATYLIVTEALSLGMIPIYATTNRTVEREIKPNGSIVTKRTFKHVQFRSYLANH
ncbi:MAG: CRISPR-associated protein Csx20 [Promethearchaeota archaeon]